MGVVLVNGNGNHAVYAAQDSDLLGGISGQATGILDINDKFSATIADANTVEISSGVCITKEGRRIQIDVGDVEEVIVPTGSQGTTKYYIIGFHLYTDGSGNQLAETFIDEVESSTATITENMFKDGETEVYVSLYRITRNGLNLEDLTLILPEIPSLGDLKEEVAELSTDLSGVIKWRKLWTNASPSSSFSAQDIQTDGEEYDFVKVYYSFNNINALNVVGSVECLKGNNPYIIGVSGGSSGVATLFRYTNSTPDNSYVKFGNCTQYTGNSGITNNNALIPIEIWLGKIN